MLSGACALVLVVLGIGPARCAPAPRAPLDVDLRLRFLEDRLDAGRSYAQAWQEGWSAANAVSVLYGTYEIAALPDAAGKINGLVNALKSASGIVNIWEDPLPGSAGADPIRAMPGATPAERRAQLVAAERRLERAAYRADDRFRPATRIGGVIVNLAGGAVIYAFGHTSDAVFSTVGGLLAGEAQNWSEPARAKADLRDYRGRFAPLARAVELDPWPGGVKLTLRF